MMHCTNGMQGLGRDCDPERYGRLGTIDPGDLILVKDIDGPRDVETRGEGGESRYGRAGDVIIFHPDGEKGTPVIHRALFWIEIHGDGTYTVPEYDLVRVDNLNQDVLLRTGLKPNYADALEQMRLGPEGSGFITRGDNNGPADQEAHSLIASMPVRPEWVLGKARGEVPWLGLVKLAANDMITGTRNFANAGSDSKVMLFVTLAVLLGGPVAFEKVRQARHDRREMGP